MKNKLLSLLIVLCFVSVCGMVAAEMKPYAFPFIGKWQPAEDPVLIDDYGFQDIQNLRKDGKRLKGVSGHTKINTTRYSAPTNTYIYPKNLYHFRKPSESHLIVYSVDSAGNAGRLYQNETAIPSAGDFSSTILYTLDANADLARFSPAPQGNMLVCDGAESLIWGGDEYDITSFITSANTITYAGVSDPKDYSDKVKNSTNASADSAVIGGGVDTNTIVLLHTDGTDGSTTYTNEGTAGNGTANGNAQLDTAQSVFGTASGLFDGTGDYVTISDSHGADDWFDFGTGNFTIDFWYKFNIGPGGYAYDTWYSQYVDANNYWQFWIYNASGMYYVNFVCKVAGVETMRFTAAGGAGGAWLPSANVWYHIALIRGWGGAANGWAITVNGTAIATDTVSMTMPDFATNLEIGRFGNGTQEINGWIDEFRISKGIARWTSNFTAPSEPYTAAAKSARYWIVGATRPLQGVKFYVGNANTATSTLSGWEWSGNSWSAITLTDGTTSGGKSLAQTGSVTWSSTVNSSEVKYIQGLSLYWYQFYLSAGEATIYNVTADAPMQDVKNIWDGSESSVASCKLYEDSTYKDYTDEVNDNDPTTVMVLDSLVAGTEYLLLGFVEPQQAINIYLSAGKENTDATVLSLYYNGNSGWVTPSSIFDGTKEPVTDSLGKTGVIAFSAIGPGSEFETAIGDGVPLYYYKLVWSVALDAEVEVYHISGIPAPKPVKSYAFPGLFQGRAFLFNEKNGLKNKAIYSVYNAPDVWNGSDSGEFYFGTDEPLVAATTLYNMYRTSGIEQLIIAKENETYRVFGDGPDNWEVQKMSGNIGCVAPLSMVSCDVSETEQDGKRQVAIWQSASGVVLCDGATITSISDDIKNYWDPNHADYIHSDYQKNSVGFYDPDLGVYKLLITSGSGATTHNVELEFSLKFNDWTKLYRENSSGANPLQVGTVVRDTNGKAYTYGGTNEGYVYRLENGKTWDSVPITEYVKTKALLLDSESPLLRHTVVDYFRLMFEDKATGDGEDLGIFHYCDGTTTATTDGVLSQSVPTDIDMADGPYETRGAVLGPCLTHTFLLTSDVSTVYDGWEITGMGLYYTPDYTIQENGVQ